MHKIAIITSYGMTTGGTEKFLQTVAQNLPKNEFQIDYYYIDSDKSKVSNVKYQQLQNAHVNLIPYQCDGIVSKFGYIKQINSNFFTKFKDDYALILNGSCGLPEEPFTKIKTIPILQSIHYVNGVDNQYNISRVLHISDFSRNNWINKGGDAERTVLISHPISIPSFTYINFRDKFNLSDDCMIFGMHQRNNDNIFSEFPLKAYSKIENDNNAFILCGGSEKYRDQAKQLGLTNVYFIPATDDNNIIYSFLKTINVYAHGRLDGELNSTALAEAMFFGLPIISHASERYNGHLEVIKENGFIAKNTYEYASFMHLLESDRDIYVKCSEASKEMFNKKYDLNVQIENLISIFTDTINDPYPNKTRRVLLHVNNCLKNLAKRTLLFLYRGENK